MRELLLRSQGLEAVWRVPRILRLAGSAPGCSTRRSLRCRGPGVGAARAETGESIGASTHLPPVSFLEGLVEKAPGTSLR